jgi:hypothetical protein
MDPYMARQAGPDCPAKHLLDKDKLVQIKIRNAAFDRVVRKWFSCSVRQMDLCLMLT